MENLQLRKQKMYHNVLSVFDIRKTVWENSGPFASVVNGFSAKTQQIDEKSSSMKGSVSLRKEKEQRGLEMRTSTLVICGVAGAYASIINDEGLKAKFNFTKTDLNRGNEIDVYNRCLNIGKDAEPIIGNLIDLNLPADQLTKLMEAAAAFNKLISAPRSSQKADKSAKEEMVKLFRDCDNLLEEQLDKLMLIYQAAQPDFCTEYANAREIGGWRKDKKKEEGDVGVPEK